MSSLKLTTHSVIPKTGIILLNMGGPKTIDKVQNYLMRIMTDRNMMQLPMQK